MSASTGAAEPGVNQHRFLTITPFGDSARAAGQAQEMSLRQWFPRRRVSRLDSAAPQQHVPGNSSAAAAVPHSFLLLEPGRQQFDPSGNHVEPTSPALLRSATDSSTQGAPSSHQRHGKRIRILHHGPTYSVQGAKGAYIHWTLQLDAFTVFSFLNLVRLFAVFGGFLPIDTFLKLLS